MTTKRLRIAAVLGLTAGVAAGTALARARRSFSPEAWDAAYRRAVARAFREVPFYREQWAAARRQLAEPVPVPASDLHDQLFRLCPLARPYDPSREPSLWIGSPQLLRDVLHRAGIVDTKTPVLEVREAIVDWERLGLRGPPYRALLSPSAETPEPGRRAELNAPAAAIAAEKGAAAVVGEPPELAAVLPELQEAAGNDVTLTPVLRLSLADAASREDNTEPVVVHDPYLGYLAARVPACGRFHLDWRRFHARFDADGLLISRVDERRPTLVNVRPVRAGFSAVGRCARHGTPILE